MTNMVRLFKRRDISYQVIAEKLHDQCGILVALLTKGVEFYYRYVGSAAVKKAEPGGNM